MPYSPASNCNAANYNPNDVVQDYQTAQKASYQQNYPNQTNDELWKNQLGGLSGIGGAALGKAIPTKSLQGEADRVRSQSDQLKNLLGQLQYVLFEPIPSNASASLEKDNPSTIEGNLQHADRTLSSAILFLENILSKIGGR
jgi:hypothetical protein